MKAVIVQPAYLPYMGYFNLIDCADVFVYLDDVQFNRRAWQHRNRVKIPEGDFTWITVPVIKDHGQQINHVKIRNDTDWNQNHWKSIKHSYGSCEYFDDYKDPIRETLLSDWESLIELDVHLLNKVLDFLNINSTEFIYSSNIDTDGQKTDLLISILKTLGADEYVSGPAAKEYINYKKFRDSGIPVYWHEFDHPTYPQPHGDFVTHLSIIDLLFNVGPDSTELIRQGGKEALELDDRTT